MRRASLTSGFISVIRAVPAVEQQVVVARRVEQLEILVRRVRREDALEGAAPRFLVERLDEHAHVVRRQRLQQRLHRTLTHNQGSVEISE